MAKKSKAFGVKRNTSTKPNLFGSKLERKRHNVIGADKKSSNTTPLGIRKESRKSTIGKELKLLNKQNKIRDQRIGQHNPKLTDAQKAELRFVAQRKNLTKSKKNKFLLNDEEEDNLEHLASGLTEAEKYQRGLGHEANEDDELDPEEMALASFGGGTFNADEEGVGGKRLTKKERVQQAIQRSVMAKALKRHDRAIQLKQWEKLDEQFMQLKEAGEISSGRVEMEREEDDDEYMELYTRLGFDTSVPATRKWAADITRKAIEEVETKEAERLEGQKRTLFKSTENGDLTFPMAVDQISETQIRTSYELAQVLIFCHDAAVYLEENRRYCPEIIGFLLNTLMLANSDANTECLLSTFPIKQNFLYFAEKSTIDDVPALSISLLKDGASAELNQNRVLDLQVIRVAVRLIRFFAQLYDNIFQAYPIVFGQFEEQLSRLPVDNYPKALSDEIAETLNELREQLKEHSPITHLHKSVSQKIKSIDMLEPRIEQNFNVRHPTHKRNDPKANLKRVQKRLKHEKRGAIKELRHDARFIAGVQAKIRREDDEERAKKTKRILASLQTQESEFKKRKKGKKF